MLENNPSGEVDLRRYLTALRRRKKIILAVVFTSVAMALVISALQTTLYQGEAQLLIQPRNGQSVFGSSTPGTEVDPKLLIDTEIKVIESKPIRAAVSRQLGSVRKVQASRLDETLIIVVKGESTAARRAAEVANAYANAYLDHRRQQAADGLGGITRQLETTITDLQGQIDTLDRGVSDSPAPQREAVRAAATSRRDALVSQQATFRQRLDEIQVEASVDSGGARLVAAASTPTSPVQPTPVRNAVLALAIGLLFGVSAAVVLEYFDDSMKNVDDVSRAVGPLPVLGVIPSVDSWRKLAPSSQLTAAIGSNPGVAEAFRSLRTAVQLLGIERPLRTIQVTSPVAADGKTTTLCNLAMVMATAGQRVLVVDCDLRRPRVHDVFGVSGGIGLTTVLAGDADVSSAVCSVPGRPGLSVLPAGPHAPNPSELLGSRRTAEILFGLQSQFDVVLVDSPPSLPVTDAVVVSTWVEATIIVVAADTTTSKQLRAAISLLHQTDAAIAGVVLNRAEVEASYGYGYGYGYGRTTSGEGQPGRAGRRPGERRTAVVDRAPVDDGRRTAATSEPPVTGAP